MPNLDALREEVRRFRDAQEVAPLGESYVLRNSRIAEIAEAALEALAAQQAADESRYPQKMTPLLNRLSQAGKRLQQLAAEIGGGDGQS